MALSSLQLLALLLVSRPERNNEWFCLFLCEHILCTILPVDQVSLAMVAAMTHPSTEQHVALYKETSHTVTPKLVVSLDLFTKCAGKTILSSLVTKFLICFFFIAIILFDRDMNSYRKTKLSQFPKKHPSYQLLRCRRIHCMDSVSFFILSTHCSSSFLKL